MKSSAFYYVALFSQIRCENVDPKGLYKDVIKNPQFYLKPWELRDLFGVKTISDAITIVDKLKDTYHAIDYAVIEERLYFHLKIGLTNNIVKGKYNNYSSNSMLPQSKIVNHYIKKNKGYFVISKIDIYKCFYQNGEKHGILDLFVLLYLNQVYNSEYVGDCFSLKLSTYRCCLWRIKQNTNRYGLSTPRLLFSIREEDLAGFINVDKKSIERYLRKLAKASLITYIPFNRRGCCILIGEYTKEQQAFVERTLHDFIAEYNENNKSKEMRYAIKPDDTFQGLNVRAKLLTGKPEEYREIGFQKQPSTHHPNSLFGDDDESAHQEDITKKAVIHSPVDAEYRPSTESKPPSSFMTPFQSDQPDQFHNPEFDEDYLYEDEYYGEEYYEEIA